MIFLKILRRLINNRDFLQALGTGSEGQSLVSLEKSIHVLEMKKRTQPYR
jgi:hypothetical protein